MKFQKGLWARVIVLAMTALMLISAATETPVVVHAGAYVVNSLSNGDFEGGHDSSGLPVYWGNETDHCYCQPPPTITVNSTESIGGNAARLDMGQTQPAIGSVGMWQSYPPTTLFSNFTSAPDEMDFWFRLDSKYAGLGDFQIKFLAQNGQELDYVIDPDYRLSYPNQTFLAGDIAGQPMVKHIFLGNSPNSPSAPLMAPSGQWVHFTREVTADWIAPMALYNNTCNPCLFPGFPLTDIFYRVEFDIIGLFDPALSTYYGMTTWIDNAKFYWNSNTPPPPPPPKHFLKFNFTDIYNRTALDQYVKWRIFNATGYIGPYERGAKTLSDATYTLEVYYPTYTGNTPEPYVIYRNTIPFDTNVTIILPLIAEPMSAGGFVGFSPTVLPTSTVQQDGGRLDVSVKPSTSASYKMIAKVPLEPRAVVKITSTRVELFEGASWFYDSTNSMVTLLGAGQALYTLYFQQPVRIPNITFIDRTGASVDNVISFNVTNTKGALIQAAGGSIPPDENYPYYLQAYYKGYRIYKSTVDFDRTTPIQLQMLPLLVGYIVVNSTVLAIYVASQSNSVTTIDLAGTGPFLIIVRVPQKPLYIEVNGAKTADWIYDSTSLTAVIEASNGGTFSIVYAPAQQPPNNSTANYADYYIAGTILAGSIITAAAMSLYYTRKAKTSRGQQRDGIQVGTGNIKAEPKSIGKRSSE